MVVLYVFGVDFICVYYGIDICVFFILLGSVLVYVWLSICLKEEILEVFKKILNGVGLSVLVFLVLVFLILLDYINFVYYGGMFLISLVVIVLVVVIVYLGVDMNCWLMNLVFMWIGKWSYGIYLY